MYKVMLISSMMVLGSLSVHAQVNRPEVIKKKTDLSKPVPASTPAPAPEPVYTLTAVKVNIRTGSDNKEYPSDVWAFFSCRGGSPGASFKQKALKNEMKVNSNTEFGLEKEGAGNITLADLQTKGIKLELWYFANFQFDAWKIDGISITLEIRDQNGNLHPTYGQKTITFGNASGFLNGYFERKIVCTSDGYFNPLTAQITQ